MIEAFTGNKVSAEMISQHINSPRNAFNVEIDAHESFDKLAWGIEADNVNGEVGNSCALVD
jgi:hypothetical protein